MKKNRLFRQKSIFSTIFIAFFSILLIFVLVFSITYYQNVFQQVSELVYSALQRNVDEIAVSIDNNINELDKIAVDILQSSEITDYLPSHETKRISDSKESTIDFSFYSVQDKLRSLTNQNRRVDQVNIIFPDGKTIASGLHNDVYVQSADSFFEINSLTSKQVNKVIYYSDQNPYISNHYSSSSLGKGFVSVVQTGKTFKDEEPIIVDVKKSVIPVTSEAEKYHSVYGENLYLFDKFGNQIYPVEKNTNDKTSSLSNKYFSLVQQRPPHSFPEFSETLSGEYLIYHYSPYSNIYSVMTLDKSHLMSTTLSHYMQFILFIFALLILAGFISFFVANIISRPINTIHGVIKKHDFMKEDFFLPSSVNTKILEINTLIKSFNLMQKKINKVKVTQLELQKREMQSKMLSLQSQMNPHFLYNSLATIQAMANEEMNDEIITMCQTTSRILRYISSDKESKVSLVNEISHTQDYLECMRTRYDGDLSYRIDIPPEMNNIQIPKLCVQLLVEISIKFTTEAKPPWKISIRGTVDYSGVDNYWYLSVLDNGPGFTEKKLNEIREQISRIDSTGLLPSLELQGMGLLNVCIRLKLSYDEKFIFHISNGISSGAEVLIGGKYEQKNI